ncbi:MAG TPA: SGNH/GDSL hydrolase family protein [Vicinamibacterales bacterium]|nr:SGNH/GDSL hydrolase family protein [Vicinamibacterales bacterium]
MKHGTFLTAMMAAVVVMTACGAPPTQPKPPVVQPPVIIDPPPPPPSPTFTVTKIMAFGDSLTEGDPPEPGEVRLMPAHDPSTPGGRTSYPYKLSTILKTTYTEQAAQIQVFNLGLGGEQANSSVTRARLSDALAAHQPEVVLLMHGTNDLLAAAPQNATVDAVEELIKIAQQHPGVQRVFLASLPPQLPSTQRITYPDDVPIYNDRLRNLALATGAKFVDIFPNIDTQTMMDPDGLHINEAGNQRIAEVFYAALKPFYHRDPQ